MIIARALASIFILLFLAGCAPTGPAQPGGSASERPPAASGPKRIVAAITGDPPTLYNKLNTNNAIRGIDALEKFVVGGLANEDDQAALRPQLATAVPSLDNGQWLLLPDGRMETTWNLRPEAR